MSNTRAEELAAELLTLTYESDEDIDEFISKCEAEGFPLDLEQDEETDWNEEGDLEVATVTVTYKLKLGDYLLSEWTADYMGSYGCGGTGWWVGQTYSDMDLDQNIDQVVEAVFGLISCPEVPEPRSLSGI